MTLHLPVGRESAADLDPARTHSDPGRRARRLRRLRRLVFAAAVVAVLAYLGLHVPADGLALADLLWTAGVLLIVFLAGWLLLRRRGMVAFALAVVVVGAGLWVMAPRAAAQRSGDPAILRNIDMVTGLRDVSSAVVDLGTDQPVHYANTGSSPSTQFEIGSISKALTGMVIADEVQRGELDLASPMARYLPALAGSPLGGVPLQEVVTHHAGLAGFAPATMHRAIWSAPLGRDFLTEDTAELIRELRADRLTTRGQYAYSSLGAAAAGQAAAAAAGMGYPELMQARLFGPLGMRHTSVQTTRMVRGGVAVMGRPIQPWVMDAYAPAGAVVSTSQDLATLAVAVLQGRAPGLTALTPVAPTARSWMRIGTFWMTNRWDNGLTVTWHNGGTAGYTAWIGIDREHQRAAVVLGDTAKPVDAVGEMLLSDR